MSRPSMQAVDEHNNGDCNPNWCALCAYEDEAGDE